MLHKSLVIQCGGICFDSFISLFTFGIVQNCKGDISTAVTEVLQIYFNVVEYLLVFAFLGDSPMQMVSSAWLQHTILGFN